MVQGTALFRLADRRKIGGGPAAGNPVFNDRGRNRQSFPETPLHFHALPGFGSGAGIERCNPVPALYRERAKVRVDRTIPKGESANAQLRTSPRVGLGDR